MPVFYLRVWEAWVRKSLFILDGSWSRMDKHMSTVGATIIGRISDYTVIKWRRKREGVWYPEDRLRASLIPFASIVPLSVLSFGLVNRFVDGRLGLVLSLVCLFFNGVGVSVKQSTNQIFQKTD